jgi:hypothetical protein
MLKLPDGESSSHARIVVGEDPIPFTRARSILTHLRADGAERISALRITIILLGWSNVHQRRANEEINHCREPEFQTLRRID